MSKLLILFITIIYISCNSNLQSEHNNQGNCVLFKHDSLTQELFQKKPFIKKICDSFIIASFVNNYSLNIKRKGSLDSISILQLDFLPQVYVHPFGDSTQYDILFWFKGEECDLYYNDAIAAHIHHLDGLRIETLPTPKIKFITTEGAIIINSSFMDFDKILYDPNFIRVVQLSRKYLNNKLDYYLSKKCDWYK